MSKYEVVERNKDLEVKEVDFNGATLMATQLKESEKIYVGVRWVCEGMGLTVDQTKRQIKNIQSDIVLNKGVSNLTLLTNGGLQSVLCVELDFLPLWLAKISITPKMKENSPELVNNLVEYQLKAKDVLARAFIKNDFNLPQNYKEALTHLLESVEENEKLTKTIEEQKPKVEFYDDVAVSDNTSDMIEISKALGVGRNKFMKFLKSTGVLLKEGQSNIPAQKYQDAGYFEVDISIYNMPNGKIKTTYKTTVTGKGKSWLYRLLGKYGGANKINSLKMAEIDKYVNSKKK